MKIIVIPATLVVSKAKSFTSFLVGYDGHSYPFLASIPKIVKLYKEKPKNFIIIGFFLETSFE